MAGFALLVDQQQPLADQNLIFINFLESVAGYKSLAKPERFAIGSHCMAAKLDSATTLHHEFIEDKATGSWLMAVGTVIDHGDDHANGNLQQLLTDYLTVGSKVFARLDGHFALIIYDGTSKSVNVISDPFGIISVFYAQKGSRFFISTSALAIAKAIQSRPSELGMRHFLTFGNVIKDVTLWQDVKRMLPATVMQITQTGCKESTYWSVTLDQTAANLSLNESVDYIVDLLSQTMQRSLHQEEKLWLSLTGGFDSRTLAMLTQNADLPFKSYCHGPPESSDVRLAQIISQTMDWEYEYFPLPEDWGQQRSNWLSQTLGFCDGHLDLFKTSRIIREQTLKAKQHAVSLWGFGGEIYRGFYWKQEFLNVGKSSQVDYDRLFGYRLSPTINWSIIKNGNDWAAKLRANLLENHLKPIGEQNSEWLNTAKLDLIGTNLDGTIHAGAHISAALGLQRAVAPFYFKEGLTRVLSINYKWRTYNRLFRAMLERVNPMLANIETADGGPALPMRLTNLHKFMPYWFGESKKLTWAVGHKFLGVKLWNKNRNAGSSYPLSQWRKDTVLQLEQENLLQPAQMRSANLYNIHKLQEFLAQIHEDEFKAETLLSRMVTIEMAMRSVGASF